MRAQVRVNVLNFECLVTLDTAFISRRGVITHQFLRVLLCMLLVVARGIETSKFGRLCDYFILIAKTTATIARSVVAVIAIKVNAILP